MKRRYFVAGLVAATALANCGFGKPAIVGKWKCPNPDGSSFNIVEYLADGTHISTLEYVAKPSYMDELEWGLKKDQKQSFVATWKAVDGDRIQLTRDNGVSNVFGYKINGNMFEYVPPNGVKCDRL